MIVYPILNFVLPLIYSSFLLVGNPYYSCTECRTKAGLSISESKKYEEVGLNKQTVSKDELTEDMHSDEGLQQSPLAKE